MAENRLAAARSSYLKSAAHQPVDWHPWGAEAFEKAKREDRPILLDIGAVWCHWCHVMDRESYEDAAVAGIINARFVAVKVDRDERPDVDIRYQRAIQAMTGQGGWPLTAFLLPDGRPFYGGTYFPPADAHGRPSFTRVLTSVADAYVAQRDQVLRNADALAAHLAEATRAAAGASGVDAGALLDHAVGHMQEAFDAQHGGFGRAPKFPHPAAHDLLLARGLAGDTTALDMVTATLEAMQAGGIHDQLAGGFHRYSVDREWIVPHFEKMLYDNAGLLRNYARAGAALGRDDFRATADGIVAFLRDVLRQPDGGFGGSQDADIDLEDDGDHFTWTLDELRDAVAEETLAARVALHYGVREQGDMHHDPRRNVLHVEADAEALAAAAGRSVDETRRDLDEAKRRMRAARAKRPVPFIDPTSYTAWNGMAIGALLEHGGATGDASVDALALAALDVMTREAFDPQRGFARSPRGRTFGLLDDNAHMLDALLEAHLATGDARHLDVARQVADLLIARFPHPDGGFADRAASLAPSAEVEALSRPERPLQDAPTASGNGVALAALLRLSAATGDARYAEHAEAQLARLSQEAAHLGLFGGALLSATARLGTPHPRIVIPTSDPAAFRRVARASPWLQCVVVDASSEGLPEEARAFSGEGALVCVGTRCLAPARTPEALGERLSSLPKAYQQG